MRRGWTRRADDHAVGLTEGAVGISSPPRAFDAEIGAQIRVDQGCAPLDRLLQVHHGGQRLVIDLDHGQGILRARTTGGHHRRHGLSRILRDLSRHGPSALGVHAFPDAREAKLPLTLLHDLLPGQHRQHSRQLPGSRGIYPTDVGVGVRAAEHGHVRHAAELHVPGILPCAGDEAGVFFPLDCGANQCGSRPETMADPPYEPMVFVSDKPHNV